MADNGFGSMVDSNNDGDQPIANGCFLAVGTSPIWDRLVGSMTKEQLMVVRVCGGGGVGEPSPQIGLDQRLRSPWPFFARMEQEK